MKSIKQLSKEHPPLRPERYTRYMPRISRLKGFYEDKAPDAPLAQGYMFMGFVSALMFVAEAMEKYNELCQELKDMSREIDE
jgi:hypothetical protein